MKQWLMMGGYAPYVWLTYVIMLGAVAGLVGYAQQRLWRVKQMLTLQIALSESASREHDASGS